MARDDLGRGHDQAGGAGQQVMVKTKFVEPGEGASQALTKTLYYIHCRPRGELETAPRALFMGSCLNVDRRIARAVLNAYDDRAVKFHHQVLSPAAVHGLRSVAELQEWARGVMASLEYAMGMKLLWVGVVHRHPAKSGQVHPQVHVLICGSGERRAPTKRQTPRDTVRIKPAHLRAMREAGYDLGERLAGERRAREIAEQDAALNALVWRPDHHDQRAGPESAQDTTGRAGEKEQDHARGLSRLWRRRAS